MKLRVRFVVTAGPTREYLDPVRFLSNPSTGRMGFAIAAAAARLGFDAALIAGPVELATPKGVRRIDVTSARDMLAAALAELDRARAGERVYFISSAAVADWRPAERAAKKLKKSAMAGVLRLRRNPDILKTLKAKRRGSVGDIRLVGFAAETGDPVVEARRKCRAKGLDFIVANDVTAPGCGFGTRTNRVTVIAADGSTEEWPLSSKSAVGSRIVRLCLRSVKEEK